VELVADVSKSPRSFAKSGTTRQMTHRRRYECYCCENLESCTNFKVANV